MLASAQRLTSNVSRTHLLIGLFFNTTCYNHVMLTFSYKYIIVISLYSICNIGYLFFILWFYYKDFYYYYYYLEGAFFLSLTTSKWCISLCIWIFPSQAIDFISYVIQSSFLFPPFALLYYFLDKRYSSENLRMCRRNAWDTGLFFSSL